MSGDKKIVVGIPTFRRPRGLARLLASVALQEAPCSVHVLVADNQGPGGEGLATVDRVRADGYPFPLTAIAVPERGISQVRNALMRVAFEELAADGLAMVDDDERVEPGWLAALVAMQEQGGYDVVGGAVVPEFEHAPPAWSSGLAIYWRPEHPPGAVSLVHGTGNVLLGRGVCALLNREWFDPGFGLTGGGDKEFFTRLRRRGATFGFAPEARCHEYVGTSRMTRRWALQRAFRIGSGDARILRLHEPAPATWAAEVLKLGVALVGSPLVALALAWHPRLQMRGLMTFFRQLGKLNGLLGRPPKVYGVTHGR